MVQNFIYAGIGSRKTPLEIQEHMVNIGEQLADRWTLRSGHAEGADVAFEVGAVRAKGKVESFLPWPGFNTALKNDKRFIVPPFTQDAVAIASAFHPAWDRCNMAARKLHTRNVYQILGLDLKTPVDMVICWTGQTEGGTGQALRIARGYDIPIFNLNDRGRWQALVDFIQGIES